MPQRLVLFVAVAACLAPATVTRAETPTETLHGLLGDLGARVADGVPLDRVTDYREHLATLDRSALDDDDWLDLHCALLAVDRRLDPAPEMAAPAIDTAALDKFDVLMRNRASRPIGSRRFEWMLRRTHGLPFDGIAITTIGLNARQRAREALASHAVDQGVGDWHELIAAQREDAPASYGALVTRVREDVAEILAATEQSPLVTVPDVARLLNVHPAGIGFPYPFAAYYPGKLEADGRYQGRYVVAPLPPGLDAGKQAIWLGDFDPHFMRVVTAHESYPGHHLQFACAAAATVDRPIRGHGYNSVYVEGWGFYCERLVEEIGALDGPLDRLAALRMRAWRAVRCHVDFALHTERMRPSEAVELLVAESGMSRRAAESEVKMYLDRPTQALSYEIGRRLIERMRAEFVVEHGEGELRTFHDRLLAFGVVPLPLARAVLLDRRAEYDRLHP